MLKRVLERYIPVVTVISGATVGALASGADLIGTVGNASGAGVLLSVGIMIQLSTRSAATNDGDASGAERLLEATKQMAIRALLEDRDRRLQASATR